MIAELVAFDRCRGQMELPNNYDLTQDIHLDFHREIDRVNYSGQKIGIVTIEFNKAVFRFMGSYRIASGEGPTIGRPIFHLVDLIK